jgi:hypothetical protein
MGTAVYPLVVKQPGLKIEHSLPSNAELKNERSYTSTVPYAYMAYIVFYPLSASDIQVMM